jgi:hypothetical protein
MFITLFTSTVNMNLQGVNRFLEKSIHARFPKFLCWQAMGSIQPHHGGKN